MNRFLLAAGVFALVIALSASAQDTRPGDPKQPQPKAGGFGKAQPDAKFGTRPLSATMMMSYEEGVELLEAQRETRKAHVREAEVAVKIAEVTAVQMEKAVEAKGAGVAELEKARLEVDAAKARRDIQMGELKEVEVRIKFAKKRLEEVKAVERGGGGGDNPFRKLDRKQVDPPPSPDAGREALLDLKKRLLEKELEADVSKDALAKAAVELRTAKAELAAIRERFDAKFADHPSIASAREVMEKAKAAVDKLSTEHVNAADALARLKAALKGIEK